MFNTENPSKLTTALAILLAPIVILMILLIRVYYSILSRIAMRRYEKYTGVRIKNWEKLMFQHRYAPFK